MPKKRIYFSDELLRAFEEAEAAFAAVVAHCDLPMGPDWHAWQRHYNELEGKNQGACARLLGHMRAEVRRQRGEG